jgi:CRP/FNR family cyclic AMP-dependent transcriptional regulator
VPDFTDDDVARIACAGRKVAARRRTVLYGPGDTDQSLYYLLSGRVRISCPAPACAGANGREHGAVRELTLHYVRKGQLFGEFDLHHGTGRETRAEVIEDAVLLVTGLEAFERLTSADSRLALRLVRSLARRQRELEAKIEAFVFKKVPCRLAETLLALAAEYGVDDARGTILATRFTHRELASLIGASRPTVTETLEDFVRRELIIRDGRRLILKRGALRRGVMSVDVSGSDSRVTHGRTWAS